MKHLSTFFFTVILSFSGISGFAQSFYPLHDTMYLTSGGVQDLYDTINNTTSSSITLEWKVISTDFPSDWQTNAGFCDPDDCIGMYLVWPSGTIVNGGYQPGYGPDSSNVFLYSNDLTAATSTGCYYLRVRMNNHAIPTDTAIITYMICKPSTSQVVAITSAAEDEITFYPNPAINTLNVVYSEMLGVKSIAIYSVIGKQMNIFTTTDNKGAMLTLDNIPSGIYYLRLLNGAGGVIATRRFMKQ